MPSPYSHMFEPSPRRVPFDFKGSPWLRYAALSASLISVAVILCGIYVTKSGLNVNTISMIVLGIIVAVVGVIIFAITSPIWIVFCCAVGTGNTRRRPERRLSFVSDLYSLRMAEDGFNNPTFGSEESHETLFPRPPTYQSSEESLHRAAEETEGPETPTDEVEIAPREHRLPSDPPPPYSE